MSTSSPNADPGFEIKCPSCKGTFIRPVGELKAQPNVKCPRCGAVFRVDPSALVLEEIEREEREKR